MMHSTNSLYDSLRDTLAQINSQIAAVVQEAEKRIAVMPYPDVMTPYMLKNPNGEPILTTLLAAKAQVLSGMAALKTAETQQRPSR